MGSQQPEPDPQDWPTYPHGPASPQGSPRDPDPRPGAYADPSRPQQSPGDAFPAYPPDPGTDHNRTYPYQQPPPQRPSPNLNQTWLWIIAGIVASFVIIVGLRAQGAWTMFLFVGVAWWIWNKRKRG